MLSRSSRSAPGPFERFVRQRGYPCVMARSVVQRGQYTHRRYAGAQLAEAAHGLARDLARYAAAPEPRRGYRSFVASFPDAAHADEAAFEADLWALLRALHTRDRSRWDPDVSADPDDPAFSFSFAGRAFYVVGLHPGASRPARRSPEPMLVFNLHAQFDHLREAGRYDRMRSLIRERDRAFSGSVNPMLDDFGTRSEARQYSGRAVEADWRCPFHAHAPGALLRMLPRGRTLALAGGLLALAFGTRGPARLAAAAGALSVAAAAAAGAWQARSRAPAEPRAPHPSPAPHSTSSSTCPRPPSPPSASPRRAARPSASPAAGASA